MRAFGILALALLGGCASLPPQTVAPAPNAARPVPVSRPTRELRVMTFNLRVRTVLDGPNIWDRRRDLVVQRVRAFDPDLLGTQEGLDSMERYLRQQLGDYTFLGVGRDDGKLGGEMCGIFFKTARFELLDRGCFWLSTTPEKPGSRAWGELYPRVVMWVKLQPRDGGPIFYWFNTHFDAFRALARLESARLLQERIAQLAGPTPCVVTGDFNSSPGSPPYQTLLASPGPPVTPLHDVFRDAHPIPSRADGTVHFFTGWRGGQHMDWILASPQFQTIDAEIDHARGSLGYPSDHFPVTATLRAGSSAAP